MSNPQAQPGNAADIKSCCADAYSSDVVTMLLGDSYHPGGLALTRRLAGALNLQPGDRVLDVACGRGATAIMLAAEFDVEVVGVDLSESNVESARKTARKSGVGGLTCFTGADAEQLPFDAGEFDAVVCECALCTFPDKEAAAGEFSRVLRPGGRAGITDITADFSRLPPELTSLAAWIACIADARPLDEYAAIFAAEGLRITRTESHDQALSRMISQIEARLTLIRMTALEQAEALGVDFSAAPGVLGAAQQAVADQVMGYGLVLAEKPR